MNLHGGLGGPARVDKVEVGILVVVDVGKGVARLPRRVLLGIPGSARVQLPRPVCHLKFLTPSSSAFTTQSEAGTLPILSPLEKCWKGSSLNCSGMPWRLPID